jgi:hypothetical protein
MFQLIKNPAISEAFVRKHEVYIRETITTQMMWSNPNLSETFVNERLDEVDWDTLVANNQVLDEKFYMKHQHKLDNNEIIGNMAANSKISLEYIMSNVNEHLMDDEYFWHCIFRRRSDLKLEFLEKYFKKIGLEICLNSNVPIEFFLKYPQFQNNYFFQDNSSIGILFQEVLPVMKHLLRSTRMRSIGTELFVISLEPKNRLIGIKIH